MKSHHKPRRSARSPPAFSQTVLFHLLYSCFGEPLVKLLHSPKMPEGIWKPL